MASGYKGFRQIYQQANRRLSDIKKHNEMKTATDNLKKFTSFLLEHTTIDGYMGDAGEREVARGTIKQIFKTLGKKAFQELAIYLGLKEVDVHFNPGGPGVSGDLILMGMFGADKGIYLSLNKDGMSNGVLYRSIKSMKDYSGGQNNYFQEEDLNHPDEIKEKIIRLLKLNEAELADSKADSTLSLLTGNEWFKDHPEKVLGESYQTTDRFGKPITKVKGNVASVAEGIAVAERAQVPEDDTPLESEIKEPLEDLLSDPEKKKNIERVVNEVKKKKAEKALRKIN